MGFLSSLQMTICVEKYLLHDDSYYKTQGRQ
jgi:hypothetical protein